MRTNDALQKEWADKDRVAAVATYNAEYNATILVGDQKAVYMENVQAQILKATADNQSKLYVNSLVQVIGVSTITDQIDISKRAYLSIVTVPKADQPGVGDLSQTRLFTSCVVTKGRVVFMAVGGISNNKDIRNKHDPQIIASKWDRTNVYFDTRKFGEQRLNRSYNNCPEK